jgi:methylthioribose-1-phosphate isomerase
MQRGLVDCVMVSSDLTTAAGDVCNKIGTYLKARAAKANDVPFYVALPVSSIDWWIEEREPREVLELTGLDDSGELASVSLFPESSPVANSAFDVTPARYVTALLTEWGTRTSTPEAIAILSV